MSRWEVTISGWHPTSLNVLHASVRRRIQAKQADRRRVAQELHLAGVPTVAVPRPVLRDARALGGVATVLEGPMPRRRRLEVVVVLGPPRGPAGRFHPMGQAPDPDNLLKSLLDALVDGGFLVDDSSDWLQWSRPEIRPHDGGGPRTILTLEDLG